MIKFLKKIDRRIRYFLMCDTETCNTISINGRLDMSNALTYDIGVAVCDKRGKVYLTKSYIVKEIFFGMQDLMKSAYYANKIPQYLKDIEEGKREVKSWYEIRKEIMEICEQFEIDTIVSHNARFDNNTLKVTQRYNTCSKYRFYLPFNFKYYDTLKMARDTICKQKRYIKFCEENGYMTKHKTPQPRATAEILYRYITNNNEFVESHTGLEDCLIEAKILAHCYKQHKKMRKALYE